MNIKNVVVSILAAISLITGCTETPDTYTSATMKNEKITLPKPGETYTVLGMVPGLRKFTVKYDKNYYRGGMLTSIEGMKKLKENGVKTIISITPNDLERLMAEKYNVNLVELDFNKEGIPSDKLDLFMKSINEKPGPFYVHCHG